MLSCKFSNGSPKCDAIASFWITLGFIIPFAVAYSIAAGNDTLSHFLACSYLSPPDTLLTASAALIVIPYSLPPAFVQIRAKTLLLPRLCCMSLT